MIVMEKYLAKIINDNFNSKPVLFETNGIIKVHIWFKKPTCIYEHENGILYLFDVKNNVKVNIAEKYKVVFNKNKLEIKLDNGENIDLWKVIKRHTI